MNARVKARWLKALRSGRYKQATGALRVGDGYCCLGVLCDLARKSQVGEWEYTEEFDGESGELPPSVVAWAGLPGPDPEVMDKRHPRTLSDLNDRGANFERIAALIEKGL